MASAARSSVAVECLVEEEFSATSDTPRPIWYRRLREVTHKTNDARVNLLVSAAETRTREYNNRDGNGQQGVHGR